MTLEHVGWFQSLICKRLKESKFGSWKKIEGTQYFLCLGSKWPLKFLAHFNLSAIGLIMSPVKWHYHILSIAYHEHMACWFESLKSILAETYTACCVKKQWMGKNVSSLCGKLILFTTHTHSFFLLLFDKADHVKLELHSPSCVRSVNILKLSDFYILI